MAEVTEVAADPSMEEILASIRKIISDDKPPETPVESEPETVPEEEVLELTNMVQEDGSVVDLAATAPAPSAEPVVEPAAVPKASAPPPSVPQAPPAAPVVVAPMETLVSAPAAQTAASALSSLANTVEIERLSSAPGSAATYIGNGSRTLEDMTIELMRPLLKDWLDKNLPTVVERLVQKEIERIARRS
jgi:cell pole-organizing protein PopZ